MGRVRENEFIESLQNKDNKKGKSYTKILAKNYKPNYQSVRPVIKPLEIQGHTERTHRTQLTLEEDEDGGDNILKLKLKLKLAAQLACENNIIISNLLLQNLILRLHDKFNNIN